MSAVTETTDWQGIALSVSLTRNWLSTSYNHLEIHVLAPETAKLPITETGYRSHFTTDDPDAYGGLAAYVRAWLGAAAAESADWARHCDMRRQLALF